MKLSLRTLLLAGLLTLGVNSLAGELKVGATPVPHAELLNLVKDDLKSSRSRFKSYRIYWLCNTKPFISWWRDRC